MKYPPYLFKYLPVENITKDLLEKLFSEPDEAVIYWPKGNEISSYTNCKYWVSVQQILKYKLYITHYVLLNDPCECQINIDFSSGVSDRIIDDCYKSQTWNISFDKFKKDILSACEEKVKLKIPNWGEKLPLGIFSLAEDPSNIRMWSHYGNNHQGLCIAFEINWKLMKEELKKTDSNENIEKVLGNHGCWLGKLIDSEVFWMAFQKVHYSESPNMISAEQFMRAHYDEEYKKELAWELSKIKYKGWEYEQEWRLVSPNQYSHDEKDLFPLDILKYIRPCGIILGCKMEESLKKTVKKYFQDECKIIDLKFFNHEKHGFKFLLQHDKDQINILKNPVLEEVF